MGAYLARRLMLIPFTLVLLSMMFFGILRTIPGDVVDFLFAEGGTGGFQKIVGDTTAGGKTTQEAYEEMVRKSYGLGDPVHVQYVRWVGHVLQGDFGDSYLNNTTAFNVFKNRLPATLQLGIMALVLSIVVGIPLGVLSARYADTWVDNVIRMVSLASLSTPSFVTAAVIVVTLSTLFAWVPPDYVALTKDPWRNLQNMFFPVIVIGLSASAPLIRLTRSQMLEVLSHDYIRTARAKGLSDRTVFYRHALRNAILPVVTVIGLSVNLLVAGSVIAEVVFGINGMGAALVRAAQQRDYPVLQLFVMVFGVCVLSINLLVDMLYGVIDPRVRYS